MITDKQMTLAEDLDFTSGTQYSTNAYDTGAVGPNINENACLELVIVLPEAAAGGTNATFNFIDSANANLSSPTVLATTGAIVDASLTLNARIARWPIPENTQRYIGVQVVNSGTHTAGQYTAYIVETSDSNRIYEHETGR